MIRTIRSMILVGIATTAISCGGTAASRSDSPYTAHICDGRAVPRVRAFTAPQNSRELRGSVVRVENGFASFMMDGTCTYWVGGGWDGTDRFGRDRGWRTGEIDGALARTLDALIPVDAPTTLDDCAPPSGGAADYGVAVIWTEQGAASCPTSGPRFTAAWNAIASRAVDLWTSGAALDGAVHLSAVNGSGAPVPIVTWTLSTPLASFLLDPGVQGQGEFASGVSHLVTDAGAASALRDLRDQYIAHSTAVPGDTFDGLQVSDGKTVAYVYQRDALPYEDDKGLLPGPTQ